MHLDVLGEYITFLTEQAREEWTLLCSDDCKESIIERWLRWGAIEERFGFKLPYLATVETLSMADPEEGWVRVWNAIRAMAPLEVAVEGSVGGLKKRCRQAL